MGPNFGVQSRYDLIAINNYDLDRIEYIFITWNKRLDEMYSFIFVALHDYI